MDRPNAEIARHTLNYGFGFVVGGIARLVLVPVIARTLTADEYGVYALLLAATAFLQIVFEVGFVETLIRFHHERPEPEERRRLRARVFAFVPLFDGTLALPLILLRERLSWLLFGTSEHGTLVAIAVATASMATLLQLYLGHVRAEDRSGHFVVVMALRGGVALTVTLALVFVWDLGIAGFLLGQLAAPVVVTSLVAPRLLARTGLDLGPVREQLGPLVRFGLPLMPSALGMWGLSYLDAYLLRAFADLESVGVYRFAAEVCMPLSLVLTSFLMAWPSYAFARAREAAGAEHLALVFRYAFVGLATVALATAALRGEILTVLGATTFLGTASVVPLWALATCLYGAAQVFGTGLQVAGDTRRLPLYVLAAIALNAALAVVVIPVAGAVGLAVVKVVTLAALALLVLVESNRQFRIPFPLVQLGATLVAGGVVLRLTDAYGEMSLVAGTLARAATLLVFPVLLVLLRVVTPTELRSLPALVRELLTPAGSDR